MFNNEINVNENNQIYKGRFNNEINLSEKCQIYKDMFNNEINVNENNQIYILGESITEDTTEGSLFESKNAILVMFVSFCRSSRNSNRKSVSLVVS